MKDTWILDEEGIICSKCGKDIHHCTCGIKNSRCKAQPCSGKVFLYGLCEFHYSTQQE